MAFQTFAYFTFLAAMLLAYCVLPKRLRWGLLLIGSYCFYLCWNQAYVLLLFLVTLTTYACGLLVHKAQSVRAKKRWLAASLVLNLGILVFFKYYGLLAVTLHDVTGGAMRLPVWNVLMPVGISFYIFQAIGYTVDVYRGDVRPVRHFGKYALFVSFFPQIVSGPIGRCQSLAKQFDHLELPTYDMLRQSAVLILVGLVKKLVISDHLTLLVDKVYADVSAYGAPAIIVAAVGFTFQIYCDFSGYSDIAVGSAGLFGIRLMRNFDKPYLSVRIAQFWRRWHISLSSWFRDYLYFPLGGSRVTALRWGVNILIVFLLSGLWHGAAWTFCAWGLLNGLYQVVGRITQKARDDAYQQLGIDPKGRLRNAVAVLCTFVLTTFAWVFFRAQSFAQVGQILQGLATRWEFGSLMGLLYQVNGTECLLMATAVGVLVLTEWLSRNGSAMDWLMRLRPLTRSAICLALLMGLILFGKYNESPSFIYFRF